MDQKPFYWKEALKEPVNIAGLLLTGIGAVYGMTMGIDPTWVLGAGLLAEGTYLVTVPASSFYRRIMQRRNRGLLDEVRVNSPVRRSRTNVRQIHPLDTSASNLPQY